MVKQAAEPLYSSRLSNTNPTLHYSNIPTPLHSQSLSEASTLPLNNHYNNTYVNTRESPNIQYSNIHNVEKSIPCLSISSNFVPKAYVKPEQHVLYSNVQVGQTRNNDGLIYSNLIHAQREGNVYSNLPPSSDMFANGGKTK